MMTRAMMKIFLPSDSEEFVRDTIDQWKKHMNTKQELDQKMVEKESVDEFVKQFSEERDGQYVEDFVNFVATNSNAHRRN